MMRYDIIAWTMAIAQYWKHKDDPYVEPIQMPEPSKNNFSKIKTNIKGITNEKED
jgi:hypothetical protein